MGKSAAVTGGIGDIVYSIPVMRKLGVDTLYIKEDFYGPGLGSKYTVCKPLLELQGIQCLPIEGGLGVGQWPVNCPPFDYDLDAWRCRPGRDRVHIIKNMCLHYRVSVGEWNKPFLHNIRPGFGDYALVFLTKRWRENSKIQWSKVVKDTGLWYSGRFIGLPEDYENFCSEVGHNAIPYLPTKDLLSMAMFIQGSKTLYCNQGVALTIAQGLGKPYWLEVKPGKSNTLFFSPNEHILK